MSEDESKKDLGLIIAIIIFVSIPAFVDAFNTRHKNKVLMERMTKIIELQINTDRITRNILADIRSITKKKHTSAPIEAVLPKRSDAYRLTSVVRAFDNGKVMLK